MSEKMYIQLLFCNYLIINGLGKRVDKSGTDATSVPDSCHISLGLMYPQSGTYLMTFSICK